MANPITVTAALAYANPTYNIAQKLEQIGGTSNQQTFAITGKNYKQGSASAPTTAGGTAIDVSGLSTLGWTAIRNLDAANYVQILSAVSGTVFLRINAGEMALFRFDGGITAPAILANTAAVEYEFLFLEN